METIWHVHPQHSVLDAERTTQDVKERNNIKRKWKNDFKK